MEKISSILPGNPRVKTVDLTDSHPVRPGAPTFGQKVGNNSLGRDRVTLSDEAAHNRLLEARDQTLNSGRNPRDAAHVKIANDMTNNFFLKKLEPLQEAKGASLSEEVQGLNAQAIEAVPMALVKSIGAQPKAPLANEMAPTSKTTSMQPGALANRAIPTSEIAEVEPLDIYA
jgi:hypothetical protein